MSLSVNNNISFGILTEANKNNRTRKITKNTVCDSFELKTKENKSSNGKFDVSEAAKNFLKGAVSPLTAIVKHPVITGATLAATAALCVAVPVAGSVLAVGFGALSIGQLGKGIYDTVKNYKQGKYDDAEKSMQTVGQGTTGTVLTLAGMKSSAKVAREAKLMSETGVKSLTQAQREAIASDVNGGSLLNAIKDNVSLFTTKTGLKATINQLKPSMIKTRVVEFTEVFKGKRFGKKEVETKVTKEVDQIEKFKKSPEGIRRAGLSDEEISTEVRALFDEAFDEIGIPKDRRPEIVIENYGKRHGGSYSSDNHVIEFNPEGYRNGLYEIENVVMHESVHCKEALLRAGIPQDRVDKIVINELIKRIQNGESEQIIVQKTMLGAEMLEPPKMSKGMREDFAAFAKEVLYKRDNGQLSDNISDFTQALYQRTKYDVPETPWFEISRQKASSVVEPLEKMIKAHPEFVEQFESEQEAVFVLCKYSLSHHNRFKGFSDVEIVSRSNFFGEVVPPLELTPEELVKAEESLVNLIDTVEGNARISGLNGLFAGETGFNQYRFSPEEVLAEQNGQKFLIEKLIAKMDSMRQNGTLTPEDEAFMTGLIDKSKLIIECRTKGLEYYKHYTRLLNNPEDKELAALVDKLAKEIKLLDSNIFPSETETIIELVKVTDYSKLDIASMTVPELAALFPGMQKEKQ